MSSDDFGDGFDDLDFSAIDEIEKTYSKALDPYFHLQPLQKGIKQVLKQKDLFGGTIIEKVVTVQQQMNKVGGPSSSRDEPKIRLIKKWDRGSFAIHGWSKKNAIATKSRAKGKGKAKAYASDEEGWGDEVEDDESEEEIYLDTNFDPNSEALPIKWQPDEEASKTWVYPVQDDKPLRTYQYNIVYESLFDNTLVSLPTGLGKTFIAACVMLNFYRWYPKGKIIFLAPTRPLVTQQIKACHYIAGIKQEDCVELTGQTNPSLRAIAWSTKRVIYSTPQTVENDLRKGRLDPRDVTCLVVDEAHRASGDYAYVGVVRYLMSVNPHFRLLALTATPGARGDAVQSVIDNLHIGKIQVRTDESMDITQYIHKKTFDLIHINLPPLMMEMKELLGTIMKKSMKPLLAAGLLYESDPGMLSPFGVTSINVKLKAGGKAMSRYYPDVKELSSMARAMEYLLIHSITSAYSNLLDLQSSGPKWLKDSYDFKNLLKKVSDCMAIPGFVAHPKMGTLSNMCREHFESSKDAVDEYGEPVETRVMVFCNFRAVVDELVEVLNRDSPLIRATEFVGQGVAKGKTGKSQKQQLETIRKFKKGDYNVLVATSIGEEGLDIGEIDLIICYEANKSPIRMLQRVGRTGRARDGKIIVLMTNGREEKNWSKANDAYDNVQSAIVSGKVFDLYNDGERMLPKNVKPTCEKVCIKALPLIVENMTMAGHDRVIRKATTLEKQEKKKLAAKKNIPIGAKLGFMTATELAALEQDAEGPPKKKKKVEKTLTQDLRERKVLAFLSAEEEIELQKRYQYDLKGQEIKLKPFDTHNLPFNRTAASNSILLLKSSKIHLQLRSTFRKFDSLKESEGEEDWYELMGKSFIPDSVVTWERNPNAKIKPHKSLKRPVQNAALSSPIPVGSTSTAHGPLSSRILPTPTPIIAKSSSKVIAKPIIQPIIKPIPKPIAKPIAQPAPKTMQPPIIDMITILSSPEPSPPPKIKKRSQTLIDIKPVPMETFDPSGVLSSDEEEEIVQPVMKSNSMKGVEATVGKGRKVSSPARAIPQISIEKDFIPDSEDEQEPNYFPNPLPPPAIINHLLKVEEDSEMDFDSFELNSEDFAEMDFLVEGLNKPKDGGKKRSRNEIEN